MREISAFLLLHVDAVPVEYVHAQFVHNIFDGKLRFYGVAGIVQRRREGRNTHYTRHHTHHTASYAGLGRDS